MKNIVVLLVLLAVFAMAGFAHANKEVPYTLEDRERLTRLEVKVEEGFKAVNQRIDGLQGLMYVVIGAVIAQTIGIVGFVLWDRRTALSPAIRKTKELEDELEIAVKKAREVQEKEEKVEKALREYAKKEPELAAILKEVGISH